MHWMFGINWEPFYIPKSMQFVEPHSMIARKDKGKII